LESQNFFGTDIFIWPADAPTDPWWHHSRITAPTATGDDCICTYDATCRPLLLGGLLVRCSNNAYDEADTCANAALYPTFVDV
jgi:hypothetical protein